jgi:hypothetical protein
MRFARLIRRVIRPHHMDTVENPQAIAIAPKPAPHQSFSEYAPTKSRRNFGLKPVENAQRTAMLIAIHAFATKLKTAGPDAVGSFTTLAMASRLLARTI